MTKSYRAKKKKLDKFMQSTASDDIHFNENIQTLFLLIFQ